MSLNLHKLFNEHENILAFEHVTLMDQMVCTRKQINFEFLKNKNSKIGLNTTPNKLYPLTKLIGLNMLRLGFVHFKKLAKVQFLKNGKT